jgi:hypothetical protein
LMDRQRLKNWQRHFTEQIELAREFLFAEPSKPRRPKSDPKPAPVS